MSKVSSSLSTPSTPAAGDTRNLATPLAGVADSESVMVGGDLPLAPPMSRPSMRWLGVRSRVAVPLLQLGTLVVLLGAWQLCASQGWLDVTYVSEPSRFIPAFWADVNDGDTRAQLWITLYETLVGFFISSVLGVGMGIAMAESARLEAVTRPFLTAFNNIPRIALAPLFVLWFGLGTTSRIVLIVSLGFFVVTFNTHAGIQAGGRDYLLLAKTLGAGRFLKFRKFVFPSALPAIFAGLQLCLTYAFMGAVVGEMLGGSQGLGGFLALKIGTFDTDAFFGGLLLLVVVSLMASTALGTLERWLLRWRAAELGGLSSPARN